MMQVHTIANSKRLMTKMYTHLRQPKEKREVCLYYELAPQRPDIVLKDLVAIFHPELLPEYEPYFFKPLQK